MTLTDERVVELCDAAIAELEKRGLAKGWFMSEDVDVDPVVAEVCTMGAFYLASGYPAEGLRISNPSIVPVIEEVERMAARLLDLIPREELERGYDIAQWNDAEERTVEDVILAIKRLREEAYAYAILAS